MDLPRRGLIRTGVAITAAAWVTPSVLTLDRIEAATGSCVSGVPTAHNGAVLIDPPLTLEEGTLLLDSNTTSWVFLETGPFVLTSDLVVNRTTAGKFFGSSNENAVIGAGTSISSYYVHGDRLDDNGVLTGELHFSSANLIGLIYRSNELTASSYLQSPSTTYFPAPMENIDQMTLTTGLDRVSWEMQFDGSLDGIRVIVACL